MAGWHDVRGPLTDVDSDCHPEIARDDRRKCCRGKIRETCRIHVAAQTFFSFWCLACPVPLVQILKGG